MPKRLLSNPDRPELSESKFRTYEKVLAEFLKTYPAPYRCKPADGGALTTLVVRLREAANAVLANSHKFTIPLFFDVEAFRDAWSKVNVSIRGDEVVIGPREALAEVTRAQVAEAATPKDLLTISNPLTSDLEAFAGMLLRQCLNGPVLFVGEVPEFTRPLGIAFEQTSEGWLML